MKKIIGCVLVTIVVLGLIGCSKQYSSSSVNPKQEYAKTFSLDFATESTNIAKESIDLYNQAIADKVPDMDTFKSKYKGFSNVATKNADEKDLHDFIMTFGNDYTLLSSSVSILMVEQNLRDSGMESKEKDDATLKEYQLKKVEHMKQIKIDLDNIMKYYQ